MQNTMDVTHVLHWIPPELNRTRRWFGWKIEPGYWEIQPLDAYEAPRYENQGVDFVILDAPDCRDATAAVLEEAVASFLGWQVSLEEDVDADGNGMITWVGWAHWPLSWVQAPVYMVRPAVRQQPLPRALP